MEELKHQELVNYKLEQIAVRLDKIDKKLDDGDSRYVNQEQLKSVILRVKELEDTNKWLNRLVIGVVILALLGGIIISK